MNGLEIKKIPNSWRIVSFGDVATFTKKPRDLQYSDYNEIPFVPMNLIPVAELLSAEYTLKSNDELSSGTYFEPGDILLSKITPSFENGKQCIIEELPTPFGIATTEVIPIREVVGVSDKRFLFYHLLRPEVRTLLAGRMQGSTGRQRLGKETLINLQLLLPPLPEQRAIASVLGALQEAKLVRQKEIALERERKAALMEYLFSHGTKGEPRKQTEIGEIPESWEIVELNKVCLKIVDCPHSTPKFVESGVLCTRNVNIRSGIYVKEPASYTSEDEYQERIKRLTPQEGDILFSREAPIGEACVIPRDTRLSLGQRLMLLRVNPLILDAYFLVQSFYVTELRSRLLSQGRGVTAKHLNVGDVKRLEIPIPSFDEQQEISEVLIAFNAKIAALEKETALLDELFHAMLEELMTGKRSAIPLIDAEFPN